jgi:hypothetical protein
MVLRNETNYTGVEQDSGEYLERKFSIISQVYVGKSTEKCPINPATTV